MKTIAFLGLGAMGSRMATRLIGAGYRLRVWNRTPVAVAPFVDAGASKASTPADAADGADVVVSMVRDDDASASVWLGADGALAAMTPEATGVECSTLSLDHVRNLNTAFAAAGRQFVDAPVAGSRPQAEAGQLIFLAGGAGETVQYLRPIFDALGAATHHAGPAGAGTLVKLMVNGLFGTQVAVVAELIGLAQKAGIDPRLASEIIGETPVASPAVKAAAESMVSSQFAPLFPIDLVAKDFCLLRETAKGVGAGVPVSSAVGGVFSDAAAAGFGADNITGIMQQYSAR